MAYKNKEKQRAYQRTWKEKNKEAVREHKRQWNKAHKEEIRAYHRASYQKHKQHHRSRKLQSSYGITWEDKMAMFLEQDGKCLICGKQWEEINTDVHTDHCHRRGTVRGLICTRCNTQLGYLEAYMYNLDGKKSAINKYLMKGMDM